MSASLQPDRPQSFTGPRTFPYKYINGDAIVLDLYDPILDTETDVITSSIPCVIYFHGGGLTVGNRTSWMPHWWKERTTKAGVAFISADYRLIPPGTGHEVLEDIIDLFHFIEHKLNSLLSAEIPQGFPKYAIDSQRVAVSGSSSGGLCAYLSAMHATPKPKAVIGLYAMGGNFLTPYYYSPKHEVFFRGRELLDPNNYTAFLHPKCANLKNTSDSPLSYHGSDAPIPGFPANPRMLLSRLYLQLGTYIDYYTGEQEPSLSGLLRRAASGNKDLTGIIPEKHHSLCPQLYSATAENWPPTFLIHGSSDSAVKAEESISMYEQLKLGGVDVKLRLLVGQEHSFDYAPSAIQTFGGEGGLFDEVLLWTLKQLRK